jgi:glycosyltransferase involved in cell wall biosynthesis
MPIPVEPAALRLARPLRIVHLSAVPDMLGFLRGHLADLAAQGFEVVLMASPGPLLDELAASEGVARVGVPITREITPTRDLVSLVRLVRAFRAVRPDVVDVHSLKAGLLGVLAARLAGVPVCIYHLHGLRHVTTTGLRRALLRASERFTSRLATRVLCVSRSVAREALADGLVPAGRTAVLLGGSIAGVDATGRFTPARDERERRAARAALGLPADAPVLGFVGRLVRDKGVVELAGAWRVLRERHPALRLVVVGVREPGDPVPDDVYASLAGDPRVLLAGHVRDTPRWYRAMDVLALPTYREGFPVVTLEAAAMAIPLVATRIPGCVDAIVDGVTGTLVPPRDVPALTAALGAYLGDAELRARHGEAARARVLRDFDQRPIWNALRDEYVRLASAAGRTSGRAPARPALGQAGPRVVG